MRTLFVFIVLGVIFMSGKNTIAERNNNPLNIRHNPANKWKGLDSPNEKQGFANFRHPMWGFRAGGKILDSYARRGVTTLSQIINTFAPAEDNNNPASYIKFVSGRTGISADQQVTRDQYPRVLAAMARLESGKEWPQSFIDAGLKTE